MDDMRRALRDVGNKQLHVTSGLVNVTAQRERRLLVSACQAPTPARHSAMTGCSAPYLPNTKCTFVCEEGYAPKYKGYENITCLANRMWSGVFMGCAGCSKPPPVRNTNDAECSAPYLIGEKCSYQCKSGYGRKSGDTIKTCTSDRKWSGQSLRCRPECPTAPDVPNATKIKEKCSKEQCSYECKDGYRRSSGHGLLRCSMIRGTWIGVKLNCTSSG
ncbi:CSMD3 [Branchiostoma lanceolatum]|uniref:CSMD3 protein n=1 Tax=Branchiostoma lanceolatum TaxID=7740 RepID=A0A8J9W1R2_BRALA|nr:CSMD3 [Branchiostoma lanceolatum]